MGARAGPCAPRLRTGGRGVPGGGPPPTTPAGRPCTTTHPSIRQRYATRPPHASTSRTPERPSFPGRSACSCPRVMAALSEAVSVAVAVQPPGTSGHATPATGSSPRPERQPHETHPCGTSLSPGRRPDVVSRAPGPTAQHPQTRHGHRRELPPTLSRNSGGKDRPRHSPLRHNPFPRLPLRVHCPQEVREGGGAGRGEVGCGSAGCA